MDSKYLMQLENRIIQLLEDRDHLEDLLIRIVQATPHSMCSDADAWAKAEEWVNGPKCWCGTNGCLTHGQN
jgi:hypothetical protein